MKKLYYKNAILFLILQLSIISTILLSGSTLIPKSFGGKEWIIVEVGAVLIFAFCIANRFAICKRVIAGDIVFLIILWRKWENISGGITSVGHVYIEKVNLYYKKSYVTGLGDDKYYNVAYIFLILIITFGLSMLYLKKQKLWSFIVLPVTVLVLCLMVGFAPALPGMAILFMLICFVFTGIDSLDSRKCLKVVLISMSIVVVSSVVGTVCGTRIVKNNQKIKEFQFNMEQAIKNLNVSIDFSSGAVDNHTPTYKNKEVFTITSSSQVYGNLYLKSFSAGEFTNSNWRSDANDIENDCQEAGFDVDILQQKLSKNLFDSIARYYNVTDYEINYTKNMTRKLYMPYGTLLPIEDVSVDGDSILKKGLFDKSVLATGVNQNSQIDDILFNELNNDKEILWYNEYAKKYAEPCEDQIVSEVVDDYKLYYYDVDASSYWGENEMNNNIDRYKEANGVAQYLSENYKYSLKLDNVNGDVMDYFLNSSHKGYCVHFATAGALILKEMGIPCRYASGYVVKQNEFIKDEQGNYVASVKDSAAHAWVEIYLDGIGWIPIEMTPGYASSEAGMEDDTEDDVEAVEATETELEDEGEDDTEDTTENNTETESGESESEEEQKNDVESETGKQTVAGNKTKGKMQYSIWIAIGMTLFILIITMIFIIIKKKKRQGKKKRLVIRSRVNLLKRHRLLYKKQRRRFKSDAMLEQYLIEVYQDIDASDWNEYMRIIKKARFSNEDITESEFKKCAQIYTKIGLQ